MPPAARLFTLIHELAHIWIGKSGVSDASPDTHQREEIFCNAVAAEFLVPEAEFDTHWQHAEDWKENLPVLEAHFRVSTWVIARRALTLRKISRDEYRNYVDDLQAGPCASVSPDSQSGRWRPQKTYSGN